MRDAAGSGVETDVVWISREVHQVLAQHEGGDAIADLFGGFGRDLVNQVAYLPHDGLRLRGEVRHVLVNRLRGFLAAVHSSSCIAEFT